jgi:hypothetical protein|tara:strand:+ start:66 stop:1508 length:1443 start_codon:yes stop_codon:yes gene_type:complete
MGLKIRDTFNNEGALNNADFKGRSIIDSSHTPINSITDDLILGGSISSSPEITGSLSVIKDLLIDTSTLQIKNFFNGVSSTIIQHQHNQVPLTINYDLGKECMVTFFKIHQPPISSQFINDEFTQYSSFIRNVEFSGSNDNSNFTPITQLKDPGNQISTQKIETQFTNPNQFRYYRFKLSEFGTNPNNNNDVYDYLITSSIFISEITLENKESINKINRNAILPSIFSAPPIRLERGWNFIGYNLPYKSDIFQAMIGLFESLPGHFSNYVQIIKQTNGTFRSFGTAQGGTLGELLPHVGYLIYLLNTAPSSFITSFKFGRSSIAQDIIPDGGNYQLIGSDLFYTNRSDYISVSNEMTLEVEAGGWQHIAFPRYHPQPIHEALRAAFADTGGERIEYDPVTNTFTPDPYSFPLQSGKTHIQQFIQLIKKVDGIFQSYYNGQTGGSLSNLDSNEGYMVYFLAPVTLRFAGDPLKISLPLIDQ